MKSRRLEIKRIHVRRMPGFPVQGFTVPAAQEPDEDDPEGPEHGVQEGNGQGLAAGVNVIHGPNASGKTTLAQAVRSALWPGTAPPGAAIRLTLHDETARWNAEHEGGTTRWHPESDGSQPLDLPGEDAADRYVLSLHELIAAEGGEDRFARAVLRESTGGYNVMEAAKRLEFRDRPPRRHHDANKAARTAAAKRDALAQQRQTLLEENRLRSLRDEHEKARDAARRVEVLDLAIEHAEAVLKHTEAQKRLETLPHALEKARGDETERLHELDDELAARLQDIEEADAAVREEQKRIDRLSLNEHVVDGPLLDELRGDLDDLRELARETGEQRRNLAQHTSRQEAARDTLGKHIPEETLARLDPEQWSRVARFANLWERHQQESRRLDAEDRRLSGGPPQDLETLRRGADHLRTYLAQPESGGDQERLPVILLATLGTATAIAAAALLHVAFLLPAVIMLGIVAWSLTRTRDPAESHRNTWRHAYGSADLPAPAEWDERTVRIRLREIEAQIAKNEIRRRDQERLEEVRREREQIADQKRRLLEQRAHVEQVFGPAPGEDPRTLLWVVERALDWRRAHDEVQAAEAALKELTAREKKILERVSKRLRPYGYETVDDANRAAACVKDLERRVQEHREAVGRLAHERKALEKARRAHDECTVKRRALFDRFQVPHDEPETLKDLLARHEEHQAAKKETQEAAIHRENTAARLRRHSLHRGELEQAPPDVLEKEREAAQEQAARAGALHREIVEIEQKVREAKHDTKAQEAVQAHEEAQESLKQALLEDCAALIGHRIANLIHEKSRDRDRPPVFHRARELLLDFTKGRYRLEFDDHDPPTFKARDTTTQRSHGLQELSSATQLHLLLAVRIAFIEHQEGRLRLPIILDETLATSDDLRAGAVIDAVVSLSKTGRQVIYLTAQGDEVAKWRSRLEQAGVPYKIVDLARERGLSQRLGVPELEPLTVTAREIPVPNGSTHAAYADVLEVPPFDPRSGPQEAHLWYFIEDVELLHRLLTEGITTYGQLEALLEEGIPVVQTEQDETSIRRAQAYASAAAAYAKAWRVGRGKKVDRSVLQASGAVSEKFIDRLNEIAQECDGDARRILEAIDRKEAPGFRSNKRDQLENYLSDNGHLDPRGPLDNEEIRIRTLAAVAQEIKDHTLDKNDVDGLLERLTARPRLRAVTRT